MIRDSVVDVLIRLRSNAKVTPEEADLALDCYTGINKDIDFYKDHYRQCIQSGLHLGPTDKQRRPDDEHVIESAALQRCRSQKKHLETIIEKQRREINELKDRLSSIAGQKITENNPDITDLSDPFRPILLVEKFRQVYDDDWTHAFEELEQYSTTDTSIIDILADLLNDIEDFCGYAANFQMKSLTDLARDLMLSPKLKHPKHRNGKEFINCKHVAEMSKLQENDSQKHLKDFRKSMAVLSAQGLVQIFDELAFQERLEKYHLPCTLLGFNKYIEQSVRLVWLMKVQDPPIKLLWQKPGELCDRSKFSFYTNSGPTVSQCVWPAVLLHDDGPLMSKGIVQGKK